MSETAQSRYSLSNVASTSIGEEAEGKQGYGSTASKSTLLPQLTEGHGAQRGRVLTQSRYVCSVRRVLKGNVARPDGIEELLLHV